MRKTSPFISAVDITGAVARSIRDGLISNKSYKTRAQIERSCEISCSFLQVYHTVRLTSQLDDGRKRSRRHTRPNSSISRTGRCDRTTSNTSNGKSSIRIREYIWRSVNCILPVGQVPDSDFHFSNHYGSHPFGFMNVSGHRGYSSCTFFQCLYVVLPVKCAREINSHHTPQSEV